MGLTASAANAASDNVPPGAGGPFEDGIAVFSRHDYAAAMRIFRPLADKGNAEAAFFMGDMYDHGLGVPQSSAQAATWFRKAADQGHALSASLLGGYYLFGVGVPQNYVEAMRWSLKAAKQGDELAQSTLGMIYQRGYGVPQNYIFAYMWFSVSAHDQNYKKVAQRHLDEIASHMAPSQIAEAQMLAQRCLQSNYSACNEAPQPTDFDDKISTVVVAQLPSSRTGVPLKAAGGIFVVPVQINGAITLNFAIDSGASDVSVPADVFFSLKRAGTIKEEDVAGKRTYLLADGSKSQLATFTIKSLKVGSAIVENVRGSIAPSQGSLLLGQSFLQRFKSWSIDNTKHELLLEPL
jgi:clan AA aspartic protease (TIGR02281 family)